MQRAFAFNPHLLEVCIRLGRLELSHLLLMDNAALPWFILVPETDVIELCDLQPAMHAQLFAEVHALSRFVRTHYEIDKLNVAAIGNVVPQMHLHVIGRRRDDYCWPGPVWGTQAPAQYAGADIAPLRARLGEDLGGLFTAHRDG